jgi:hypothetical protein
LPHLKIGQVMLRGVDAALELVGVVVLHVTAVQLLVLYHAD